MTGISITTRLDSREAQAAFRQLERAVSDMTPLVRAIGTGLVASTQDRFDDEQSPDGAGWAPLHPLYAAGKRGAGILRESAMRGGLQGSITYRAGRTDVTVGSNKVHAAVHQLGATIRPKSAPKLAFVMGGRFIRANSVTIPARPYLGISREDEQMILETVEGYLERSVATRGGMAARAGRFVRSLLDRAFGFGR
jgi:phage virion morphogenesis protein